MLVIMWWFSHDVYLYEVSVISERRAKQVHALPYVAGHSYNMNSQLQSTAIKSFPADAAWTRENCDVDGDESCCDHTRREVSDKCDHDSMKLTVSTEEHRTTCSDVIHYVKMTSHSPVENAPFVDLFNGIISRRALLKVSTLLCSDHPEHRCTTKLVG